MIFLIFYAHSEIVEYSTATDDISLLKWSFYIKNILLLFIIGFVFFKEIKPFKSKKIRPKTEDNMAQPKMAHSEEVDTNVLEDDGFDNIRKKRKLYTSAEKLLEGHPVDEPSKDEPPKP